MYNYEEQKNNIFTEEGHEMFLKIRDKAHLLLKTAGAFTIGKVISGCAGDGWLMLACIDRLAERGEIQEITGDNVAGQDRVFIGRY